MLELFQTVVGSMEVCCYLLICPTTKKAAVVDPGGDVDHILELCQHHKAEIEYIIATHGHSDHVCGNRLLREATGAKILMHKEDAEFFAREEVAAYFSRLGLEASPPPDQLLEHGEKILIGKEQLDVIHTPGHTPGGICLYNGNNLLTGDTLFVGGIGRSDFPGGSHKTLLESIHNKILTLPEETVVWPGHGYGGLSSTIGAEKRSNPFL